MMQTFRLQPCDDSGPLFREPWEAQAFALALALHQQGAFSWDQWAQALSDRIEAARTAGDPDLGDTYYQHWLAALEQLIIEKQLTDSQEIASRIAAWKAAYLATPHGQSVELDAGIVHSVRTAP